ncbi:CSC1-like protein ERD4 [Asparagus officinalis]|uniref:CSC1-like protein ERD4 n=1 Tax=Asparagus officinalis TaxID=4686 RepID=UPI00098E0373|nr:CSC1-like protein ERD4 [Asparagus officinalis]
MDFSSFVTSLATSFVIFIVLMLVFTWLSRKPGNEVIYYPNRIVRGLDPVEGRRKTRNPFTWIKEAAGASEADVVAAAGVDTAVYLLFLSSVLAILVLSGLILLPVLLPLAGTDHGLLQAVKNADTSGNFTRIDKLAMGNIQKLSGIWRIISLVSHILVFFLFSYACGLVVTFTVLWRAYKHASDLRATAKTVSDVKAEDFTVLVRDIPSPPKGESRKEQVDSYFRALHPDTFYKSMVITNMKEADKIWEEVEGYKKKLARAEVVFAESKTASKPEGTRPTNRTGFLGLIGEKVDTINYCNEKIDELILKLETEQKKTLREKQQNAALIFFSKREAAVSAAQTLHSQLVDTWVVTEAPEPRQVLWANLSKKFYERQIRQFLVYGIVFLTVVFYMIPIAFISAITTLDNLRKAAPFLKVIVDRPAIKAILQAYLPQLALILFLALLPKFLMMLSKAEGLPSESQVQRAASGKYFYFIIFNVFLGVTITGTLFTSLKSIIKHPKGIVDMLAKGLPINATFFLTYVALKFFVGYGLELSRLVPLIIFHIKKKYLCKTEAEVKEAWAPGDLGFATRVPNDMLIVTIVLCYSVIAPLIIPFGAIYFGLGWLIARNQALKVYVPSYESYGRMWPHMHARIMVALIIYQITMFGYIGLKEFYYASLILPLIAMSFVFAYICKKRFYRAFAYTSLEVVSRGNKEVHSLESVYTSYIPDSLRTQKPEDLESFEDAQSQASKSTTF